MLIKQRFVPEKLPELGSLPPLLQRIYAARGVSCAQELDNSLKYLLSYEQLKGIPDAVALLLQAIVEQQRILIIGDFDADGATATAVGVLGLRMLGATQVDYLVPNRFDYGYGLSVGIVEQAQQLAPDLIITVDNGISSIDGVQLAKSLGMRVLITDHHLPGEVLPVADAIVNPNQPGCSFPSKALAGVGVIFYVLLALRARMRELNSFAGAEPNLAQLLDLVALGTVADVVPLDANNRRLVQQGLARIRAGHARPGIKAIAEVGRRQLANMVAMDLGFIVGPRLNAAGRMDDMSIGIECLLAEDESQALLLAQQLDSLNAERKRTEQNMQREALEQLQDLPEDNLPFGICVYEQDWHQGVTGILASRLKERYHRPVIAFADAGDGSLKGSARSVAGLHIRDALAAIDAQNPQLIRKFGGHAMAAGLTIAQADYAQFVQAFDAQVRACLTEDELAGICVTDGELAAGEFALELAQQLRLAGPWGQQFPEPSFHGRFKLMQQRLVGERHLKMVLHNETTRIDVDAIAFNVDLEQWPNPNIQYADLAYRLDVNEFRGKQNLQLLVEHLIAVG
ncbi:single-stranded-DNA-specific exonuclease RecJ [Thiopseudomonas acetoxidans]|uniref:Single-stranded-DNA-specific exonuclease RecJ n=1 Tax=Thiopseudomonas acetoxidans TaxID=3041622 RepID=A0ABT7SNV3_9GAMM|nr:single-stranded-DNA-specific exonuclease RecJ [Thiopseudomonas sp. CY1220]MDM7857856.1 single-stranded-DNA-specific exonuclease RecJ [Thiopseudomonas sp. CY1220]NLC09054.1 single-stranded-DNA-specific exonuclease RecJ [Gammaproteobacteria bacterium]